MTRFLLFGSIELRDSAGAELRSVLSQPKRTALLAYLAAAEPRGWHRRDTLLALFWPEREQERARAALSKAVHHLRRALGEEALENRGNEELRLNPDLVWCDVAAFDGAVAAGTPERALELYRGDLLEGFHLSDAPEFEHWLEGERARLRSRAHEAAWAAAEAAEQDGELAAAAERARRATALAWNDEVGLRRLIALLDRRGDRAGALATYEAFAGRLAEEMEAAPAPETVALVDEVRGREGVLSPESAGSPRGVAGTPRDEPVPVVPSAEPPTPMAHPRPRWERWALAAVFVALLGMAGAGWWVERRNAAADSFAQPSVAVMPFSNLSPDSSNAYFAAGVTEDIIAQLSKIAELRVVPRSESYRYGADGASARRLAEDLGVGAVLEGSVRREADRVRVVAQLVDPFDRRSLWSETYDRELTGIFAIQTDIAGSIAAALRVRLSPEEHERLERAPTPNITAYDLFVTARQLLNTSNADTLPKSAVDLLRRAVYLDSSYAAAHAGLSVAYYRLASEGHGEAWFDSAEALGRRAVALDSNDPMGYRALQFVHRGRGRQKEALRMLERTLEVDPNYVYGLNGLGVHHFFAGRYDEALPLFERDSRLRPTVPFTFHNIGKVHLGLDDTVAAERWARKNMAVFPHHPDAYLLLARTYAVQGRVEEARSQARALLTRHPDRQRDVNDWDDHEWARLKGLLLAGDLELLSGELAAAGRYYEQALAMDAPPPWSARPPHSGLDYSWVPTTSLGYVYWKQGRREEALELFRRSAARDHEHMRPELDVFDLYVLRYDLAVIDAIQGRESEAYEWLEQAIDKGFRFYRLARLDPRLENLQGEPRFERMMTQLEREVAAMRGRTEARLLHD